MATRATVAAVVLSLFAPAAAIAASAPGAEKTDSSGATPAPRPPAWVEPMRRVHQKFTGQHGSLALFGDSLTCTLAFWASLRYEHRNMTPEAEEALALVKTHMLPECWSNWRGPEYGNESAVVSDWAVRNVDDWLKRMNPEVAVILFGSVDVTRDGPPEQFERNMRTIVGKCLNNGTVPILTTVPPRTGKLAETKKLSEIIRKVADDSGAPLIDYAAEIMRRRPNDWDGSAPRFAAAVKATGDVYDAPTLISGDGVHPSYPRTHVGDYSEPALNISGYGLRNHMTLLTYSQVIRQVLQIPRT